MQTNATLERSGCRGNRFVCPLDEIEVFICACVCVRMCMCVYVCARVCVWHWICGEEPFFSFRVVVVYPNKEQDMCNILGRSADHRANSMFPVPIYF